MTAWAPTGEYTIGLRPAPTNRISTSTTEVIHLLIAFVVLTVDLAIITGSRVFAAYGSNALGGIAGALPLGAAAALTGFVAHEFAHKVSAQRYGFWAEFRMSPFGLLFSFMTSLFGVLFAAPGATMIGGMGDEREWGRTSLAGPALNLVEGGGFLGAGLAALALHSPAGWAGGLLLLAFFNGWFAAFNLVPAGPLDGRKVWRWSHWIWAVSFVSAGAFAGIAYWLALFTPVGL